MKKLNDRINEHFTILIDSNKSDFINYFKQRKEAQGLVDSVLSTIDFREVKIKENGIEIIRMPRTTNAFRPFGKILIEASESGEKLNLNVEVRPFNNAFPTIITIALVFLGLWTLTGFLIKGPNNALIISLGWIIATVGLLVNYRTTKAKLLSYSKRIVDEVKS